MFKSIVYFVVCGISCIISFYIFIAILKEETSFSNIEYFIITGVFFFVLTLLFYLFDRLSFKDDLGKISLLFLPALLSFLVILYLSYSHWSLKKNADNLSFDLYKQEPIYIGNTSIIIGIKVTISFTSLKKGMPTIGKPVFLYNASTKSDFYHVFTKNGLKAANLYPVTADTESTYTYNLYAYPIGYSRTKNRICLIEKADLNPIKQPKKIDYYLHKSTESLNIGKKLLEHIESNQVDFSEYVNQNNVTFEDLNRYINLCE